MVMKNIWKLAKGVVNRDLGKNILSFQFFSVADSRFVLYESPWAFDAHSLCLKEITGMEQLKDVKFDAVRFWVKAYVVPLLKQTLVYARFLATQVVDVDIHKLLRSGVPIIIKGKPIWINLGYVRLPDFCYGCGRIGHTLKGYEKIDDNVDQSSPQYGE
ncbi:hypothetical protein Cgig2_030296 [Carnegiea gigantea]|uniref:DUF4283 domain-containing protein n=1 Tax=Carnegiea gigantea TaxID=171969 RepID=A0A9Q1JQI7_9CARY|nr:hypothetical protein Cgig2_030296 [Carnegiea gigantea]